MPIMPGAHWEPVSGHNGPPMRSYTGIVLHVNAAYSYDLRSFIQGSSGDGSVSCHFQVALDGTIFQYIDTALQAWCQGDGNADYLSIESSGLVGDMATPAQVASIGKILQWAHDTHAIPYTLADAPGQRGFGWHGMGAANGQPGWGHAACPGVRRDQRSAMLAAAGAAGFEGSGTQIAPPVPGTSTEEDHMTERVIARANSCYRFSLGAFMIPIGDVHAPDGSFDANTLRTIQLLASMPECLTKNGNLYSNGPDAITGQGIEVCDQAHFDAYSATVAAGSASILAALASLAALVKQPLPPFPQGGDSAATIAQAVRDAFSARPLTVSATAAGSLTGTAG